MERAKIKRIAKEKIKGNLWNIWWPLLVISFLESALEGIAIPKINIDPENILYSLEHINIPTSTYLFGSLMGIVFGILFAGYIKYILEFTRKGKFNTDTIINTIKEKWLDLLIAEALTTVIIALCTLAFVIPGIIMIIAYTFVSYIVIDTKTKGNEALEASREMMKGYKWDYFVFCLSFIGWFVAIPFTLFIILIWLVPYIIVANTIYYDELKKIAKKNK